MVRSTTLQSSDGKKTLEVKKSTLEIKLRKLERYKSLYVGQKKIIFPPPWMLVILVISTISYQLWIVGQVIGFLVTALVAASILCLVISVEVRIIGTHNQLDLVNSRIKLSEKIDEFLDDESFENISYTITEAEPKNEEIRKSTSGRHQEANARYESAYFNRLVAINIENLSAYYSLVKVHTDNSFYLNVSAGIIGFTLIIVGIIIGLANDSKDMISYIAFASGIITEFITGIFFFLYTRSIRQLKSYHDSLLDVQNILLSFKLIGDVSDGEQKLEMIGRMLNTLSNRE